MVLVSPLPLVPTDEDYCDMVLVFPPLLPTDEDYCDVVLVLPPPTPPHR